MKFPNPLHLIGRLLPDDGLTWPHIVGGAAIMLVCVAAFGKPVIRAAREFWRGYTGGQAGWWEF